MAKSKNILDLEMTRGDTKAFGVNISGLTDQDLDTAYLSCRETPDSEEYVFQKSLGDGISKVETGKYRARIAPEDTAELDTGTYYYDLEIGVNGDIFTILKGKLKITYDVTREAQDE